MCFPIRRVEVLFCLDISCYFHMMPKNSRRDDTDGDFLEILLDTIMKYNLYLLNNVISQPYELMFGIRP